MGTVTDFEAYRASMGPHLAHPMHCWSCRHKWIAVLPVTTYGPLECPNCFEMNGHMDIGVLVQP